MNSNKFACNQGQSAIGYKPSCFLRREHKFEDFEILSTY